MMLKSCRERTAQLGLHPILCETGIETMILPQIYDAIIIPIGSFQLFYARSVAFFIERILLKIFYNIYSITGLSYSIYKVINENKQIQHMGTIFQ